MPQRLLDISTVPFFVFFFVVLFFTKLWWVPNSRGTHHSFEKKKKKKTVVSLATFVALQVWYGIPNERVPKSPLNSKERDLPRH